MDEKKYPILALLIYLIHNGCDWEAINLAGKKASDILRGKGYGKGLIDLLDQTASTCKRLLHPNCCMMGQSGACDSIATLRLSCPHKPPLDVCAGCVWLQLTFNQHKCGCRDEKMFPIPKADDESKEKTQDLKWIDDETEMGHIEDGAGNQFFIWNRRARKDGSYVYRCEFKSESGIQCTAVARKFFSKAKENCAVVLESQHQHSDLKKRSKSAAGKRTNSTAGNYIC